MERQSIGVVPPRFEGIYITGSEASDADPVHSSLNLRRAPAVLALVALLRALVVLATVSPAGRQWASA